VARFLEDKGERDPYLRAEHYRRGGERERAVPLYLAAGELSHRISALSDARRHYAAAHELLAGMPESTESRRLQLDALLRQVQLGILADSPEVNLQRLDEARRLLGGLAAEGADASERTEHARSAAWIDLLSGRTHYVRGQLGLAIEEYQKVLPVAEALGDEQLLAIPSHLIGAALLTQGHAAKSQVLLARAVALQDRLDSDYERLRAAGYYATSLVMSGRYREGMALHEELMARAAESKQPAGLSVSHLFHAVSLRVCGDFTSLLRCAERTLIECHKSGDLLYEFVALSLIGWAHSFLGQHEAAVDFRSRARGLERELGGRIGLTDWFAVADAEIALRAGHPEQAVLLAEQMSAPCRREERLLALGLAEQVWGLALGRIALRDPDDPSARLRSDEADAHMGAGLRIMEQSEQRLGAAILRLEWARLLARRRTPGDAERAQAQRAQAEAQLEAAGCPHLVAEVEQAL
jgi:tetratricopeptide (TPR) repeat protein